MKIVKFFFGSVGFVSAFLVSVKSYLNGDDNMALVFVLFASINLSFLFRWLVKAIQS